MPFYKRDVFLMLLDLPDIYCKSLTALSLSGPTGITGKWAVSFCAIVIKGLFVQILGDGELSTALTIKAEVFSSSAKRKIKKAGGTMVETPKKVKWTRAIGRQRAKAKAEAEAKSKPVKEVKKSAKKSKA